MLYNSEEFLIWNVSPEKLCSYVLGHLLEVAIRMNKSETKCRTRCKMLDI